MHIFQNEKNMKKSLLVALLATGCLCVNAQEGTTVKPFRNLSIGVEAGTTGFGVELATKLHKNFQLRAGFTTLPISYTTAYDIETNVTSDMNRYNFDEYMQKYPDLKQYLQDNNLPSSDSELDKEVDLKAKLGMTHGKVLVDYYPWSSKTFHITAGAYFGGSKLVKVDGFLPQKTIKTMNTANEWLEDNGHEDRISTMVTIGDKDIDVNSLDGHVDAYIKTNGFKPYLGIGFGRAVPNNRIGVQFDLGVMFHGTPKIASSNSDISDALNDQANEEDISKIMRKVVAYPVLSLKIIGRIF